MDKDRFKYDFSQMFVAQLGSNSLKEFQYFTWNNVE